MADDNGGSRGDALTSTSLALIEEQADASIRRVWHDGQWWFSVVDVIWVLTDSANPRKYWTAMKARIQDEGFRQVATKCRQLKMRSRDGKHYQTDAADRETTLRLIQSIPSPKAEPIKQWLARVGVERLDALDAAQSSTDVAAVSKPAPDAPAMLWARYYEQLAALYYRQAAYEEQLRVIDAQIVEHTEQIGELHSRIESLEAGQRLLPEILERLGPQTLTPEHQATVKAMAARLHEAAGYSFATIYGDLNTAFHVGRYGDIPNAQWAEVAAWLQARMAAAEKQRRGR
ncbi:MAG TPA: BRO family protein [Ktedonobacterales bacterium]|nr:BRO family protein [Ktedonobacterales bacterium]